MNSRSLIRVLALVVGLVGSASRAVAQGPAPSGETINGISCDAQEGQRMHIHQHLVILDHGKPVNIPARIGIPTGKQCLYWLHTHTPDGFLHIEAPLDRSFTLGDFFAVWSQPLGTTSAASARAGKKEKVKVWVNGTPYTKDPRTIPLVAHADIVIQVGPPFAKPKAFTAWNGL
ncbi:hypothetical protein BH09GEM1_BH09GEM1_32800 [soil metagenome]